MAKLGKHQSAVLDTLAERGGFWIDNGYGCTWRYGTASKTAGVLDSLVARGLVTKASEPVLRHGALATVWRIVPGQK